MATFYGWRQWACGVAVVAGSLSIGTLDLLAQVVPGTGTLHNTDDLEDANWAYVHNWPKSSKEEDEQIRYPLGGANNKKWFESPKRGSPDVVKRVETPPGGLPGSTGALYLRTRDSGVPGHPGGKQAQDDFILAAKPLSVGSQPNYTVRVFLPEWDQWEQRNGVTFGIRAGMQGPMTKDKEVSFGRRLFGGSRMQKVTEMEPYYPGFFIQFNPQNMPGNKDGAHAQILIRSDGRGHEVAGPKITQTGWWTFGMSVSADARCHFFASPGVDELTAKDHLYSSLPYGIPGEVFNTVFFNVCSADDGKTWSTPWIIDDPKVYWVDPRNPNRAPVAQQPAPLKTAANPLPATPATPVAPAQAAPAPATPPTAPATVATPPASVTPAPAATPVPAAALVKPAPAAQQQQQTTPPAQQRPAIQQPQQAQRPVTQQPQQRAATPQPQQQRAATQQPQQRVASPTQGRPATQLPQQRPAAQQAQAAPAPVAVPQATVPPVLQAPAKATTPAPVATTPAPVAATPAPASVPMPVPATTPAAPVTATPAAQAPAVTVVPQAVPAPVAAKPILTVPAAPTEAAAPATTKVVPMATAAPLLAPAPAPAPAPAVAPAPVAAAPALPAVPMTAQRMSDDVGKPAATPKTPNPKVISADDFFAPPPRAPLTPVTPAVQPPAPPVVE